MLPVMRPLSCLLLITLLVGLGGCAMPDEMHPFPISGGRVVDIPVGPNGPHNGKANGYEVMHAWMVPGTNNREIIYQFAVSVPPGVTPTSIKVEDISDDQSYLLADDQRPWVTDHRWSIDSLPIPAEDPRLAWIFHVTPSLRVYRFTILDGASRRSVLYQVTNYGNPFKFSVRHKWGEKY